MNKLNKLYKSILEALGCKIKQDASIVMVNAGKEYEVKVDNKRTFLPTNDAMNVVDLERAFFHPACESITSKETEMDKVLRKLVTSCVYFNFKPIAGVLMKVANKTNKGLNGKMIDRLKPLKDVSKEVDAEIIDLAGRISIQTEYEGVDTRIVSYTLMRGGKTNDDEHIYYRCVPSFPFYNELTRVLNQNSGLDDNSTVIFNEHKYKVRTLRIMQAIFEIALPVVEDPSRGEAVALNPVAARMTAMMRCFGFIASELNAIVAKFRKEFDAIGVYGVETSWVEQLDDLPELASMIPPLDYNNYNSAGKTQDPTQDQQYNLFSVMSEQNNNHNNGYSNQQYNNGSAKASPTPPPRMDNEVYKGMTQLANGLYEYRFQNGSNIRVVCTNEHGHKITEQFENANGGQAYNQYGQGNWPGMPWGMGGGMHPAMVPGNAMPMFTLPNGTVVPLFMNQPNQTDPYNQSPDYNNNNSGNFNNGMSSVNQMTGVSGNFN